MAFPPQKFREIVYQILFSAGFEPEGVDTTALMLMKELKVTKRICMDAAVKAREVLDKLPEIDAKISTASNAYQLERITTAEKCALRLALFELLFTKDLPYKVAIAEAVRITRKFGTREGADYVNAILDCVYKNEFELAAGAAP